MSAGLVFAPLSEPLLRTLEFSEPLAELAFEYMSGVLQMKDADQQIVILQRVLICDSVNFGYVCHHRWMKWLTCCFVWFSHTHTHTHTPVFRDVTL